MHGSKRTELSHTPEVHVYHNMFWDEKSLKNLRSVLPMLIVNMLSVGKAGDRAFFTDNEMSIFFHQKGPFDMMLHDLEMTVLANTFEERTAALLDREEKVKQMVLRWTPRGTSFRIWIPSANYYFEGQR